MAEVSNTVGRPSPSPTGPSGYHTGRAVERVAAVTASRYHPDTLAEMRRLEEFLKSENTIRKDVPRGYYFNAQV